jgi:pimeloyl-ACP methyl ester carboxylesterase
VKDSTKRVTVAVVVVAMVLTAAGFGIAVVVSALRSGADGSSSSSSSPSTPPPVAAPQPGSTIAPEPDLSRFYGQRLRWEPCRGDFWCSTLTVPLDYEKPRGPTIDLALLKVPAGDPDRRLGSLVVNPGGPGAPGTDYAASAGLAFRPPLRERYDIIGFDPRGTGSSDPVDCLSDSQLDQYIASDPAPDTAAERQEYAGWVQAIGRGCPARSGALASHVSTVEAARDMDVLRAALGERRLDYFGASYGTKLGATYAELFPRRVGRFVLDGAVDLSIGTRQAGLEQAAGFETALRAYVTDCVENEDPCFLGDSVEEGLATISDLLDQIDQDPLPTSLGRDLEVGNAFYGVVTPLYVRDYWYLLSQALQQAMDGDGTTLLRLSDLYSSRGDDGYTDNSAEAIYAINCLDDPWAIPPGQVPAQYADFERASPTFGRVFAWSLTGCDGTRVRAEEPFPEVDAQGAAPIVVVGTTRDPATPYLWAQHLAAQLDSGVLVTRDGDGHTGYNSGNECVDEAVEGYLLRGDVPRDGLRC